MAKIFKCKGIPYYITGCPTKVMATIVAFKNRWGVTPDDLIEVENRVKQLNITLEWRTASFFESEFVVNNNKIFAKHFFTQEKSIFNLLDNQKQHTENILNEIHTRIIFNEQNIEIQRDNCIDELKRQSELIKAQIESKNNNKNMY